MYTFEKIFDPKTQISYPFMLKCDNEELLIEHSEIFMQQEVKKGIYDFIKEGGSKTVWGNWMKVYQNNFGKSGLEVSSELEMKILLSKIQSLHKYGAIYLRENGSYMILSKNMTIDYSIESGEMKYPEDINVFKLMERIGYEQQ